MGAVAYEINNPTRFVDPAAGQGGQAAELWIVTEDWEEILGIAGRGIVWRQDGDDPNDVCPYDRLVGGVPVDDVCTVDASGFFVNGVLVAYPSASGLYQIPNDVNYYTQEELALKVYRGEVVSPNVGSGTSPESTVAPTVQPPKPEDLCPGDAECRQGGNMFTWQTDPDSRTVYSVPIQTDGTIIVDGVQYSIADFARALESAAVTEVGGGEGGKEIPDWVTGMFAFLVLGVIVWVKSRGPRKVSKPARELSPAEELAKLDALRKKRGGQEDQGLFWRRNQLMKQLHMPDSPIPNDLETEEWLRGLRWQETFEAQKAHVVELAEKFAQLGLKLDITQSYEKVLAQAKELRDGSNWINIITSNALRWQANDMRKGQDTTSQLVAQLEDDIKKDKENGGRFVSRIQGTIKQLWENHAAGKPTNLVEEASSGGYDPNASIGKRLASLSADASKAYGPEVINPWDDPARDQAGRERALAGTADAKTRSVDADILADMEKNYPFLTNRLGREGDGDKLSES